MPLSNSKLFIKFREVISWFFLPVLERKITKNVATERQRQNRYETLHDV